MSYFLTTEEWLEYEDVINSFSEDTFNQEITWLRCVRSLSVDGSDDNPLYNEVVIKGLIHYNVFRSWPINLNTSTGQVDSESALLLLNNKYLNDNGYLNEHGQFKMRPSLDKFIINGLRYVNKGDSQAAQTYNNNPLIHFIVLLRDYTEEPDNRY